MAKAATVFCLLLVLAACSTTSHIPDDDQLFVGLKKIAYPDAASDAHTLSTQEELEAALATAPNGALFGSSYYRSPFPFGLWIWNATTGSHGKLKKLLNRSLGSAPVLMSQVNPALRAQVARQVLRNNGFMHGDVYYAEMPVKSRRADSLATPKKAKIAYTVRMDSLFRVDSMSYVGFPTDMQRLIDSTRQEAAIGNGSPFSVAALDNERTRVTQLFRNNGYYYYQPSYASFLADTFAVANRVQLRLQLADSLPAQALRPWYIGTTSVQLRRSRAEQTDTTTSRRSTKVMFHGKHAPIRPGVVLRNMKLMPRQLFSYDNYLESMQKVNSTGVFSTVDFQFTPRDHDTLDLMLNCIFDKPYDFYVESNINSRTIGRLGPELKIGLTRRNAFRGGEKLDLNLHGSYEWATNGKGSDMNTYQYGADASIEFPRIIPSFRSSQRNRPAGPPGENGQRRRRRRYYTTPYTIAKVSTDIIQRPQYYKMHIVSGEWTYQWQRSESHRHEFSPLTMKYQFMNNNTDEFEEMVVQSPYLAVTMSDYCIPKMRYTYTYTSPSSNLNPLRWETSLEESGNVSTLYFLANGHSWNEKEKKMFRNPYSQFLKVETSLTKTWRFLSRSQLVGHLSAGYLYSYGNSEMFPFSESFYVGGANSIRAFNVRTIGPGAFPIIDEPGSANRSFSYMMRNGNIKFQANLEYRTRLFGNLYGAIFLDAGNVWNTDFDAMKISADDLDPADFNDPSPELIDMTVSWWNDAIDTGKFRASRFFKDLATGTGVGLRYDLDFLVVRVDWGFGLHLPYTENTSGYFNISRFRDMHTLHIAIGYPF